MPVNRLLPIALVAALCGFATAQNTPQYRPSTLDPVAVARAADQGLRKLKDAQGDGTVFLSTPEGSGTSMNRYLIRNASVYRVQAITLSGRGLPQGITIVRNGNRGARLNPPPLGAGPKQSNWQKLTAAQMAQIPAAAQLVQRFPVAFMELLPATLAGANVFSSYVGAVVKDRANFKTTVEERTLDQGGRVYRTVRLTIDRTPAAERRLGPGRVVLIFERQSGVPVTITSETRARGGTMRIQWSMQWQGPKKFEAKEFALPR